MVRMFHYIFSLFVVIRPARAGMYLFYDFEDGQVPHADTLMSNSTATDILVGPGSKTGFLE